METKFILKEGGWYYVLEKEDFWSKYLCGKYKIIGFDKVDDIVVKIIIERR